MTATVALNGTQKKDFAKTLFLLENLTQEELAERTGVARRTVARWMEAEKWRELKVSITITKEEQLKNLYNQLGAINDVISGRKEQRYATPAEGDTIGKLAAAIAKMETEVGIADICSVSKGVLTFIRKINADKARELSYFFDAYIKEKL
ncbi:MAG: helix-turn-helix domain-containing protein [Tannerellaceae bacterium]|jgi:transcriptional regulator with XRE-family HTH domain|nr:helix-turn-helix domain-containing protein [Tannerellaceae bacterium]